VYDLIGDIHGHAEELTSLLDAMGYRQRRGVFTHDERKVIFLGDFIDRGPQIRQVLEIVQPMVEAGAALAVMGNHELNALAFHTEDADIEGEYLRRRTPNNVRQHQQTVAQLTPRQLESHLDWFRTLPMWLDLEGVRVVHACWDDQAIATIANALKQHSGLTRPLLHLMFQPAHPLFAAVEAILKGREAPLPAGEFFLDKDGHRRTDTRVRWYLPPHGHTYRTYALTDTIEIDRELDRSVIEAAVPYPADAKPVFLGHYWLPDKQPAILAPNVACLDFSVAKGGFLCAYRWNGEQVLNDAGFFRV
jgi:diadenosine tetraphosphatase ApaH/serine/threonine PP2A family protein phosphatase